MTVSSTNNKNRYEGNGVTTTFAFVGRIYNTSDIKVDIITRATDALVETLTITTHYTVTINGPESASIEITAPAKIPSSLQDILIRRDLSQTQTVDLPTGTRFPAVSVENALDKVTTLVQDLSENLGRVVQLPITSSDTVPGIGSLTTDEVVIYDGTNFITDGTTTEDIQNAATNATAAAASASAASGSATLASQWASLTGAQVAATDYSAKEYAIGTTVPAGSAKDWAITPEDMLVDGSGYSALHWAAKAEGFAQSINLPALGAADTVLQVNAGGTALEYGKVAVANLAATGTPSATTFLRGDDTWGAVSSAWEEVLTQTASGAASISWTSGIDSTGGVYCITFSNITPGTDGSNLIWRTGNGGSFDSGAGNYQTNNSEDGGASSVSAATHILIATGVGNDSGEAASGAIYVFDPANASFSTNMRGWAIFQDTSNNAAITDFGGKRNENAAHDRFQILFDSGTISGKATLWKMKVT